MKFRKGKPQRTLTGNCPIREHTGDGAYVGRCDFACYDGVCPRHGRLSMYATLDDRDVAIADRNYDPEALAAPAPRQPAVPDTRKEPS